MSNRARHAIAARIRNVAFAARRRGCSPAEVDQYLEGLARSVENGSTLTRADVTNTAIGRARVGYDPDGLERFLNDLWDAMNNPEMVTEPAPVRRPGAASPVRRQAGGPRAWLKSWADKTPWRRVMVALPLTGGALCLALSPKTFDSSDPRWEVVIGGWVGTVLFGSVLVSQFVAALRSRRGSSQLSSAPRPVGPRT